MIPHRTLHLFVETNWLYGYAAPGDHKVRAAGELLDRVRRGDFTLHIPNVAFSEARHTIQAKCKPTNDLEIRHYIRSARAAGILTSDQAANAYLALDGYRQAISRELEQVPEVLKKLAGLPGVRPFALDDEMLEMANELALMQVALKPYDHAILAGILVSASRLWSRGERGISFVELDADLLPWDKAGKPKVNLRKLYDDAHVWVYKDFTLNDPPRPPDFE
jgi:hypothetical protein